MSTEKENLVIQHNIDSTSSYISDEVCFTETITNNGEKKKTNAMIQCHLLEQYEFVVGSVTKDGVAIEGNITEGIIIGDIEVGTTVTIKYKAYARQSYMNIQTQANIACSYVNAEENVEMIAKNSEVLYTNIYTRRLSILLNAQKQNCKVGESNTFYIKIYNYDTASYVNGSVKSILEDKYEFVESSIKINEQPYDGGIGDISIENIAGNSWTNISFEATALTAGEVSLSSNIECYYKNSEEIEIKMEKAATVLATNVYEHDNDNIEVELFKEPVISNMTNNSKFVVTVKNGGNLDITNTLVKIPLAPYHTMIPNSLKVDEVEFEGDIEQGILIATISSTNMATIECMVTANENVDEHEINTKIEYSYDNEGETLQSSKVTNKIVESIVDLRDKKFEWNISTNKKEYVIGEQIDFIIHSKNMQDYNIIKVVLNNILPKEITLIKGTTKINSELVDDKNSIVDENLWEISQERTITFSAIAIKAKENVAIYSDMSYYYTNEQGKETFNITQTNEAIFTIKRKEKIDVAFNLQCVEGHLLSKDSTVNFIVDIINNNDYSRQLTNLIFTPILNATHFTITEGSVKQGDVELSANEDGTYTLNDILANTSSSVTYSATVIEVSKYEVANVAKLSYKYLNEVEETKSKMMASQYMTYITTPTEEKIVSTKTVDLSECNVGDELQYAIVVTNQDTTDMQYVYIKDELDQLVSFKEGSVKIDTENKPELNIVEGFEVGVIATSESKTITFTGIANKKGNNVNSAVVLSAYAATVEDAENIFGQNTPQATTTINQDVEASYTVVKKSNKKDYIQNEKVYFEIILQNTGNADIEQLVVTENLDEHFEYVEDSLMLDGFKITSQPESINVGRLDTQMSKTITFVANAVTIQKNITNKVEATGNYTNNDGEQVALALESNEINININEPVEAVMTVNESSNKLNYELNDIAEFTTTIVNSGNCELNNVQFVDNLDNHFEFVENSIYINGQLYNGNLTTPVPLGNLDIDETTVVKYKAKCIECEVDILDKDSVSGEYLSDLGEVQTLTVESNEITVDIYDANFTINKSINAQKITMLRVGQQYTFTFTLTNTGTININNLVLIDDLESNFEFVENSIKIDGVLYPYDLYETIKIKQLTLETPVIVTFDVKCVQLGETQNNAEVTATYKNKDEEDVNIIKMSNTLLMSVIEPVSTTYNITKSIDAANSKLNEERTFKIVVENIGSINFTELQIQDNLDSHIEFVENSIKINDVPYSGNLSLPINIGELAINDRKIITFKAVGILEGTNIANVCTGNGTYENEMSQLVTIEKESNVVYINIYDVQNPSMLFTKQVNKQIAKVGDEIDFILTFKNNGNISLDHVRLKDNLDELFTYVEGSTKVDGEIKGHAIEGITFETVQVDETHTVTFKVVANGVHKDIKNSAIMASYYSDEQGIGQTLASISNEVSITVMGEAMFDGRLKKTTPKSVYYYNEKIPITLTLTNTGNIAYNDIYIKDQLNTSLEFVEDSIYVDGKYVDGNIVDGIHLDNLEPDRSKVIKFEVESKVKNSTIPNSATAEINYMQDIQKTASLTSDTLNIVVADNFIADLEIEKTAKYTNLRMGEATQITLRITNTGSETLRNIIIYDYIPYGLTYVEGSLKVDYVGVEGDINKGVSIANMVKNYVTIVTFDVMANGYCNTIRNRAYAVYNYTELDGQEKTSTSNSNELIFVVEEEQKVNLKLNKASDKKSYIRNETAIFTLSIKNNGNAIASNIIVTDELPINYTFVPNSIKVNSIPTQGDINVGVTVGNLAVSEIVTVEFEAKAEIVGTNILNKFNAAYSVENIVKKETMLLESEEYLTNISETTDAVLEVVKAVYVQEAFLADVIDFAIMVTNVSQTQAVNVNIKDELSTSFEFIQGSVLVNEISTRDDIERGITIANIASGEQNIIRFKARTLKLGTAENIAKVQYSYIKSGQQIDEEVDSNKVELEVVPNEANLSITKSAAYVDTFLNQKNKFTIVVSNHSQQVATHVVIQDAIQEVYEYVTGSLKVDGIAFDGDISNGINISNLATNEVKKITFEVIGKQLSTNICNIAQAEYISATGTSATAYSNNAITNIVKEVFANVEISKIEREKTVVVNDVNLVTLTLTNTGNAPAINVLVSDRIDESYKYLDGSITVDGVTISGNIISGVNISRMESNQTTIITFQEVAQHVKTNIQNVGMVQYSYIDYNNMEKKAIAFSEISYTNITETMLSKLSLVKTATKSNLMLLEENKFEIAIENIGNVLATNIVITDKISENYDLIDNFVEYNGQQIIGDIQQGIHLPELATNEKGVISFNVKGNLIGDNIENQAYIDYQYIDVYGQVASNRDYSNVLLTNINQRPKGELEIIKKVVPINAEVNEKITFSMRVKNTGNTKVKNIKISDILSVNFKFVNGSVKINGHNAVDYTNENILLPDLNENEIVSVVFECVALIKGENIKNVAYGEFQYEVNGVYHSEHCESNQCMLNAVESSNPSLIVTPSVISNNTPLYGVDTFQFEFVNNGKQMIKNVTLANYLSTNYEIIPNSIVITSNKPNNTRNMMVTDLSPIEIGDIEGKSTKTLTFNVIATIPDNNIINAGLVEYEYQNNLGAEIISGFNTEVIMTNITEANSASLEIGKNVPKIAEKEKQIKVTINIKNIGDAEAENVTIMDVIDDAFNIVPNSLTIDGVLSNKNILDVINLGTILPNKNKILMYDVIPRSINASAITKTMINYQYEDGNNILRDIATQVETVTNILANARPNITVEKDSHIQKYLIGDVVTFRLVVKNDTIIPTAENNIMDVLEKEYEFVPNSVMLNGDNIAGNIEEGINIEEIAAPSINVITFAARATKLGENIVNVAEIEYAYDYFEQIVEETQNSNRYLTSIVNTDDPQINTIKRANITKIIVGSTNTFEITIENIGNVNITKLNISDVLENNYKFIKGTVKIDEQETNFELNDIAVGDLNVGERVIISFNAIAQIQGVDIPNLATLSYEYLTLEGGTVEIEENTNTILTTVIKAPSPYIIQLLNSVATEEDVIGYIIDKERTKLKAVIEMTQDKNKILQINNSINDMIATLTHKEINSYNKLKDILENF